VLLLGDSTGQGVGVQRDELTVQGQWRLAMPSIGLTSCCQSGARVHQVAEHLKQVDANQQRFDLALIFAGGNDVRRGTDAATLSTHVHQLLDGVKAIADRSVWLGCADIGQAPFFPGTVLMVV
jgi:lysophospholipase L1-like esterase